MAVLSLPVLATAGYLVLLTVLSVRATPTPAGNVRVRFDIVVPAHDEQDGIAATIESLRTIDYPSKLRRILVVADNCTDDTAAVAAAAGARVLVRTDPDRRGKGYALAHAFACSQRDRFADAVVVVDADTVVSPNILTAFSARIAAGAHAIQADYRVRSAERSWRTRLMALAFALFHRVRSRARERMHVSVGLRGNGMAFSKRLLASVPYAAYSRVEDVEYGLTLGLAGHRVAYAEEVVVYGEVPASAEAARIQRDRWEQGRASLVRDRAVEILRTAIRRRDWILLDLGIDLLVPPLTRLVLAAVAGTTVAVLCAWPVTRSGHTAYGWIPWAVSLGFIACHVLRGIALSERGVNIGTLAWAPLYAIWKMGSTSNDHGAWARTPRERRS